MKSLHLEEEKIIKDISKILRLKKELNYTGIKDMRNIFRLQSWSKYIG